MSTLKVYEMKTEQVVEKQNKPVLVDELPDVTNLAVVNGVLCLVDGTNDTIYSIEDIVDVLDRQSDKYSNDKLDNNVLTAIHNFFDQLKAEYDA